MATSYNSTIKLYAGVPLVKGGTEVLYLAQGAAEGVLAAFLKATYSNYYFVRDNRQAVQIDAPFGDCDNVNYISFTNASHGGKIFFAFVDRVVYINDNCTQIEFTIDPFPTYLGDTKEAENVFVVRNTGKNIGRYENQEPDFVCGDIEKIYTSLNHFGVPLSGGVVYFADSVRDSITLGNTGIKVDRLSNAIVKSIQEDGGIIIGAYMDLSGGILNSYANIVANYGDITFNPLAAASGAKWDKIKTGLYNDLLLITSNGAKQYDIEDFLTPESVTFGRVRLLLPSPMIVVYPKNYRGVADNVAEGVAVKVPSLPITANATYTDSQFFSDVKNTVGGALGGALAGGVKGGLYGAVAGGIGGLIGGIANIGVNQAMTRFTAPTVIGRGEPVVTANSELSIDIVGVRPYSYAPIEDYFDYYGYAWNRVRPKNLINKDDKAFLQTGVEFLHGSEADELLNARIMAGIKIRKTLS